MMKDDSSAKALFKGTSFVHYHQFVEEKFGIEGLNKVAARLSPNARRIFEVPIAFDWYEIEDSVEIERAIADLFFGGDARGAEEVGRYDAERQMNLVFRFLLSRLEPEVLLKRASRIMSQTIKNVRFSSKELAPKHWVLSIGGYDPLHEVHCREFVGSYAVSFEMCHAKDVKVTHPTCRLHGAPDCLFDVVWK